MCLVCLVFLLTISNDRYTVLSMSGMLVNYFAMTDSLLTEKKKLFSNVQLQLIA